MPTYCCTRVSFSVSYCSVCNWKQTQCMRWIKLASILEKWCYSGSNKANQYSIPLLPSCCQVWRSESLLMPYWSNAWWWTVQSTQWREVGKNWKWLVIQDTPLNQTGSVEDQASATGLVLTQVQGSGSILARKSWFSCVEIIQRCIPSNHHRGGAAHQNMPGDPWTLFIVLGLTMGLCSPRQPWRSNDCRIHNSIPGYDSVVELGLDRLRWGAEGSWPCEVAWITELAE